MVSLAGLSAVYPGELDAQKESTQNDLQAQQLQDQQYANAGKTALGKVFQQMVPGAQAGGPPPPPQQQPLQAPPPGQPSQPMQPPQGGPGAAPPGGPAGMSQRPGMTGAPPGGMPGGGMPAGQPQGGPPGGGMPQGQGQFDLKTAASAIAKANPGIQPRVLVEALTAALPYLNAEAKQAVAEMRQQMQQDVLSLRKDTLDERERHNQATEDRLRDENAAKQKRFDTREARLEAKQEIQKDQSVQKLALQQRALEHKIADTGDKKLMVEWRRITDAKRQASLAAASIYSVNNGMDDKQKAKLAKEVSDAAEEEIANMRNLQGSSTPTGGTPKADGTKTSDKAATGKPIPFDIRGQFDAFVKDHPELRAKAIEKLQTDGYKTDGL